MITNKSFFGDVLTESIIRARCKPSPEMHRRYYLGDCWVSYDNGKTWRSRIEYVKAEEPSERHNVMTIVGIDRENGKITVEMR